MGLNCVFCNLELEPEQQILLSNKYCMFLQLKEADQQERKQLNGAGLIVPIKHRRTVFDLTNEEWNATYTLLQEVKKLIDVRYHPDGYNLGWNCETIGGQHIMHAHFHVIPRYKEEPFAGKGIRYLFKSKHKKVNINK
ncbi:HIT domain-containing protein [Ornithinibacillus sp. L9]|uniref:HIT domain-containing protein n=1 Tax=Ornithinibacillus caprae TaxID=2678566 RepID=A0A6N8FJP6_9BACI|nr:HIT domain-containing protein [Ornithinibacillus caprae]MUK88534.1 HIT domain-containing protein [Ornithinibacillus caprae]